jgi:hypothetical protein
MDEVQLEMRKIVTLKVGDELRFKPSIQATAGPDGHFFKKHDGKKATVVGFERSKQIGRIRVRFQDGFEPKHSLAKEHFVVP